MLHLNFQPFPLLQTERLSLRNLGPEDGEDMFSLRTNIDAMRHIERPMPSSLFDALTLIERINNGMDNKTDIGWGITFKNQSSLIGSIGLHHIDADHWRAEIGYMLFPEYWNKGLMTEAIKAVLDYGFSTMNLHNIEAQINPDNVRSAALLKKMGFHKEAYFKENYFYDGKFLDTEVYLLLNNL
jgi:ribosomal-protein-alanine N-acetyltransferase